MSDLSAVFGVLRSIMLQHAEGLLTKADDDRELYLDTKHIQKNRKPLFFGAVQIKKAYVSYHLMPVYVRSDLLANISPALRRRMHGKSCFNFSEVDEQLFKELSILTRECKSSYREQGFV